MASKTSIILIKEHKNILRVCNLLKKEISSLKNGDEMNKELFNKIIKFIVNYADKFHHAKEEKILFKEFERVILKNPIHCNPIEQMLFEHKEGRKNVRLMKKGLKENNKKILISGAEGYLTLIQEHIFKEDNILYPLSDEIIKDNTKMLKEFNEIKLDDKTNKILKELVK